MKRQKFWIVITLLAILSTLITGCGGQSADDSETLKVAFVYVGPVGDLG